MAIVSDALCSQPVRCNVSLGTAHAVVPMAEHYHFAWVSGSNNSKSFVSRCIMGLKSLAVRCEVQSVLKTSHTSDMCSEIAVTAEVMQPVMNYSLPLVWVPMICSYNTEIVSYCWFFSLFKDGFLQTLLPFCDLIKFLILQVCLSFLLRFLSFCFTF
jgi:hypothetical protein